jgi:MinD-like ATPase involved in chromosome partitioning or flagellar assembly
VRGLVDFLLRSPDESRCTSLGVCPAAAGESPVWLVEKLAHYMSAYTRARVLLVDANLQSSQLAGAFNVPNAPGFSDALHILVGRESKCIHETRLGNIWILPAGARLSIWPPRSLEEPVRCLFEALKPRFTAIVVALPASQEAKDLSFLYSKLDGTAVAVRPEGGGGRGLAQAIRSLRDLGGNVIATVASEPEAAAPGTSWKNRVFSLFKFEETS